MSKSASPKTSASKKKEVTLPENITCDLSIAQWCKKRNASRSSFYNLEKDGNAPKTIKIGRHRTITPESDAEWQAKMTAASEAQGA